MTDRGRYVGPAAARGPVELDLAAVAPRAHPGGLIVGELGSGHTDAAAVQAYVDEQRDERGPR